MARPNKNYPFKKEALVLTAVDLFIKQGYENTTIMQIMRGAGLTKAGMYHYFPSKEKILDAAIDCSIAQYIEEVREDMAGLTVEEKMLRFTRGDAMPGNLMQKILNIKSGNQDSYAAYRIRERCIHAYIPVMEEIIRDGIAKGVYDTEYPRQTAEFMVLLAKSLVEPNILPTANREEMELRVRAFLQLIEVWLHPAPDHLAHITAICEDEILQRQKAMAENEAD